MKKLLLLCLVLSSCSSMRYVEQHGVYVETQSTRTYDGTRALVLTGTFVNVDSVFVQVYHDGEPTAENVAHKTFTITLKEFDTYEIKFTDADRRVKRISIQELADGWIEFYPSIEMDFELSGNLALVKTNVLRPDFIEFDTGIGRKRTIHGDF